MIDRKAFFLLAYLFFPLFGNGQTPEALTPNVGEASVQENGSPSTYESHGGACHGDTILYEDWANGFGGNNSLGLSWDTTGTYQSWRECASNCTSNGPYTDVGPLQSSTASNGYVNLDVQADAGYIYGSDGPPPEYHMKPSASLDLSSYDAPIISLETRFYHCCAIDHQILIEVSTDGGSTWPYSFDLSANYNRNEAPPNPTKFKFHLKEAIAANPSNVTIRFTWPPTGPDANNQVSGVYNWYIDDVLIKDANRNDLSMEKTAYKVDTATILDTLNNPIEYTAIPRCNVQALQYGAQVCNMGDNSVNDAKMRATVVDSSGPNMGTVVYQQTSAGQSLDSIQCIGGEVLGYRPPEPDTVWASPHQWDNTLPDTGTYVAHFEAVLGDSADCAPEDNMGPSKHFRITEREYAVDEADRIGGPSSSLVAPSSGGSYKEMTAFNAFEFLWFDPQKDTINYISFYIHDTTEAGAGPIRAGICPNASRSPQSSIYGLTDDYYVDPADIGTWVKLPITRDGQGNPLPNGLPVSDMITGSDADSLKTAYVHYAGGGYRVGIGEAGTHGNDPGNGSWIYGDFGGGGAALYRSVNIPMLRTHTNPKTSNCCPLASNRDSLKATVCAPNSYTAPSGDTYSSTGIYQDTVTNSKGCDSIIRIDLTVSDPSLSLSKQDASCEGVNDGQASVTVSGGVTPYSYQWSNGDTTASIDSLSEGTYSVTVTDSLGCQESGSIYIDTLSSLSLSTSVTDADCGVDNGSASVTVSGGNSPYSYIWSSGDTTATADSLSAGSYTVQVNDANGCEAYASVSVNNASGLSASINSVNDVTCPGGSDGAIDISVSGGTTPYSYQWNNGASTQDLSGVPAGPYQVTVKDADSCKVLLDTTVEEPDPLSLNVSTVDASCGSSDGEASVSVSGGTGSYSYSWSSGGNSATETGLSSGTYTVTVTDANGCKDSATASVSETGGPTVTIDGVVNTGCGASDGSIFVSVSGGTSPYNYQWSNGDTTQDLTGAGAGSYSLTVTDASGCQTVVDTTIQATTPPKAPICVVTVDSNSQHNLIVWEDLSDPSIKEYNVYKESFQAGVYSKIGTVQDSALGTFVDTNSNPMLQSYRYKIASVDSCGNESPLSGKHKTIHLTANLGVNDNVNLIWDDYVGFSYQTFYINRYTDSTGWEKIDSIAATDHSYTDANPPKDSSLEYVISVGLPQGGCTATRAKNYNNSISNAGAIPDAGGDSTSSIQDQERARRTRLYPNPTKGHFTLEWKNLDPKKIEVYDIFGQRIRVINVASSSKGSGRRLSLDLGEREPGVYWIRIEGKETNVERAVVVE